MERDPSGALAWLASELEAAESAGERVWLLGHMPLGTTDVFHDQSQYFGSMLSCLNVYEKKLTVCRSDHPAI